jgi:RNA polymerase sigma-70 factor (ECF subfamily)
MIARLVNPGFAPLLDRLLEAVGFAVSTAGHEPTPSGVLATRLGASVVDSAEQHRELRYLKVMEDYGPGLARVASSYARGIAEREDLSQEIAMALWTALAGYRGDASLRTFAYRIAHNRAVTHLRRRRPSAVEVDLVDPHAGAEDELGASQRRAWLASAVQGLPLGLRQVVSLRLEDMSYAEIAEIVGITEKNVSVRLTRARSLLRERMGGEE